VTFAGKLAEVLAYLVQSALIPALFRCAPRGLRLVDEGVFGEVDVWHTK
jgi:hypothetical protein